MNLTHKQAIWTLFPNQSNKRVNRRQVTYYKGMRQSQTQVFLMNDMIICIGGSMWYLKDVFEIIDNKEVKIFEIKWYLGYGMHNYQD